MDEQVRSEQVRSEQVRSEQVGNGQAGNEQVAPDDDSLDASLAVLSALVEGIDPVSGEPLPACCREPAIVDSLQIAVAALRARVKQRERRARLPANVGKPWRQEDDAALLAGWESGEPLEALAARFGRTRIGIRSRLERYGRLAPTPREPATARA